jgi:geranylgeranyl diphosphate synthase type I
VKLLPALGDTSAIPAPFLALVDASMDRVLDVENDETARSAPGSMALVAELVRTVGSGGKRIRPVFCYWGYRAGGGLRAEALAQVGAAVELLHTAAILHDDVVDGSVLRRGEPAGFRALAPGPTEADQRFGRSAAVLAGDLAQVLAERLLAGCDFPAERVLMALERFNRMRVDAIRGEYLDLLAASAGVSDEQDVRRVGALKSGPYTVVGPLLIGSALAGGDAALDGALRAYGEPLGEAFQLRDDVLGTFGDRSVTGKDPDDDLREGKQTLLVAATRRLADPEARRDLEDALGSAGLSDEGADRARAAIRDSGALRETLSVIDELANHARAAAHAAPFEPAVRDALVSLATLVVIREA